MNGDCSQYTWSTPSKDTEQAFSLQSKLSRTFLPPRCILTVNSEAKSNAEGRTFITLPPWHGCSKPLLALRRLHAASSSVDNSSFKGMEVVQEHVSAGCNRVVGALDWGGNGLVAYAAHNLVVLYDAEVRLLSSPAAAKFSSSIHL